MASLPRFFGWLTTPACRPALGGFFGRVTRSRGAVDTVDRSRNAAAWLPGRTRDRNPRCRAALRRVALPLLCLFLAPLTAAAARPLVVASLPPLAGIARRIGGERIDVETLLPAGASEETYSPTLGQVARLERASIVLRIAHPALVLEQRVLGPFLTTHPQVFVVDLARGAELLPADDVDARAGPTDPHLWLDPALLARAGERLADALAAVDPAGAALYAARRAELEREVAALVAELRAGLAALPTRSFLAYHPSYAYFARAFGLRQMAVEAAGKEPALADLVRLAERARAAGVRVIVAPPGPLERGARALADTIGARVAVIDALAPDPLATLRALGDALHETSRD